MEMLDKGALILSKKLWWCIVCLVVWMFLDDRFTFELLENIGE